MQAQQKTLHTGVMAGKYTKPVPLKQARIS